MSRNYKFTSSDEIACFQMSFLPIVDNSTSTIKWKSL